MQWDDIKANYYVDRDYLKEIDVETLPAVPYQEVAATINKGVFNPVVYRPLFEYLGMVTCRTFETPAAGTIPLFLLDRDYVVEIFGERAIELVLDGEHVHDKIARRTRAARPLRRDRHGDPRGLSAFGTALRHASVSSCRTSRHDGGNCTIPATGPASLSVRHKR